MTSFAVYSLITMPFTSKLTKLTERYEVNKIYNTMITVKEMEQINTDNINSADNNPNIIFKKR